MMFSKTCEYALRSLIFVAQKSRDGNKTGIKEIARGIDSPESFIAKILQDLSRRGLVQSIKGPGGGFYLDEISLDRTLADIVVAVDGDRLFSACALGLQECSESKPCPIHHQYKKVKGDIMELLQQSTLRNLNKMLENDAVYLRRR